MRTALPITLLLLQLCSCGPATNEAPATPDPTERLPEGLRPVFTAHGGLENWRAYRQLSYAMPREAGAETQLIDLRDRRERITQPGGEGQEAVDIGYDGNELWITADTSYRGNPAFYKNLMFYFYAMPWVLADPGIHYRPADTLTVDGQPYPGYFISYDDGVGYSPKDNYRIHYDPTSHQMQWLGYTVTGRSGQASDKFSWIKYPTWTDHGGVQLPDSLVWYTTEDNLPGAPRNVRHFTRVELRTAAPDSSRFARPPGARVVE